ncbi:hypothetical protein NP493_630g00008 [Ridgeia piscesae]|uniref:Glutathione peroxidase n=1 Tax=Ridgeia piscesae TaxID=27915 RepID=A0AAD9KSN1_RIDPI|nr:hypothetical protein NP493_630g00008 [Ridgeia piscesae]
MALRRCAQTFARTARREAGLKLNDKPCVMPDLRFALLALCQGMPNAASMSSAASEGPKDPNWWKSAKSIYEFSANDIDGNEVSLEKYRGHVCLIVNVATK